jgi:hypothetical protein
MTSHAGRAGEALVSELGGPERVVRHLLTGESKYRTQAKNFWGRGGKLGGPRQTAFVTTTTTASGR